MKKAQKYNTVIVGEKEVRQLNRIVTIKKDGRADIFISKGDVDKYISNSHQIKARNLRTVYVHPIS